MKRPALHPNRLRVLLLAGAAAMAIVVAPGVANAASVGYSDGTITYSTLRDEANHVTVAQWGLSVKVTETGTNAKTGTALALTPAPGCWTTSSTTAICPITATSINADLGDQDDFFESSVTTMSVNARGEGGNDVLHGGPGVDTLDGGGGDDSFEARDTAQDTLVCGPGSESGWVDALDTVPGDCEAVQREDPAGTTPPITDPVVDPPTGTDDPTQDMPGAPSTSVIPAANTVPASIPAQTVSVSASGVANVRVVCPADSGGCTGTVALELPPAITVKRKGKIVSAAATTRGRRARLRIGRTRFNAAAGTAPIVHVRVSKRGRQRIVRARRSRARIVVRTKKADGTTSISRQDVTIRLKPRSSKRRAGRR